MKNIYQQWLDKNIYRELLHIFVLFTIVFTSMFYISFYSIADHQILFKIIETTVTYVGDKLFNFLSLALLVILPILLAYSIHLLVINENSNKALYVVDFFKTVGISFANVAYPLSITLLSLIFALLFKYEEPWTMKLGAIFIFIFLLMGLSIFIIVGFKNGKIERFLFGVKGFKKHSVVSSLIAKIKNIFFKVL